MRHSSVAIIFVVLTITAGESSGKPFYTETKESVNVTVN